MATLHVRNVPDKLYEMLKTRAQADGRSLSAEVLIVCCASTVRWSRE